MGSALDSTEAMQDEIRQELRQLGQWFHNMDLRGVPTAPEHFLGDYPKVKWNHLRTSIPSDLSGKSVLDIGCNAGFYSFQMKLRGADRVLGIDADERYLNQARFAAKVLGLEVDFAQMSVWDIGSLREKFDIVLFMGVFYHLRHPLLALDLIREHVVKDLLIFQSMVRGHGSILPVQADYRIEDCDVFEDPGYPKLHFVEHAYSGDPTNWWIPNRACVEALLRSAGFRIENRPEDETYLCRLAELPAGMPPNTVYPAH